MAYLPFMGDLVVTGSSPEVSVIASGVAGCDIRPFIDCDVGLLLTCWMRHPTVALR